MLSRDILEAQKEAVTKDSRGLTSLLVYPLLFGSLLFNLAVGGKILESGEFDLPNLSPLISLAIDQLNQPFDDQNFADISKIDHIESKVDQDFSDFGSAVDFISNFPSKYNKKVDGNSAIQQFSSGEEPPLLQLTNLLTTKLLNNLGEDVVWPRIKQKKENLVAENENPIRILKKIRKEKEGVFGKKKHYVRRKHVNHMRDK